MSKTIKAVFIDVSARTVEHIMIEPTLAAYYAKLNADLITNAGYQANGDSLMIDAERLLKDSKEFFSIAGNIHPGRLAGNALIIGNDGEGGECDAKTCPDDLDITFYYPTKFPNIPEFNNGILTNACGCRIIWSNMFYESQCAEHLEESEREDREQERWLAKREADQNEYERKMYELEHGTDGEQENGQSLT